MNEATSVERKARAADESAEGETSLLDLPYGPDAAHKLDVYRPPNATDAPVVFMVHGGAWQFGDKASAEVVDNKVKHWVPKGYIVVSANYRLSPPDPLQQADDVGKALAFAQAQAKQWGGDPDRFVLVGHSSGAHLVSLIASDPSRHDAKPWLGTVALDSAAFDVERIMRRRHFKFYDKVFRDDPTYWREASPMHRLTEKPQPMLVVCSSDRLASCAQAKGFVAKVKTFGGRAHVAPVPLSHREINERLGTSGEYTRTVDSFFQSLGLP